MAKIIVNLNNDEQFVIANFFTGMKYANRLDKKNTLYRVSNKYMKELEKTLPPNLQRKVLDNLITGIKAFKDFPDDVKKVQKTFDDLYNRSQYLKKAKGRKIVYQSFVKALNHLAQAEKQAEKKVKEEKRVSKLN